MKILVIGEKTSQVKIFANTLCSRVTNSKISKYIYEYHGVWKNSKGLAHNFTFLPLAGHISNIDTVKGYGWGECPPIKIVYDPKALKFIDKKNYVTILRRLMKSSDELWLALDPDSEGDNIALEVVNILKSTIKKRKIPVRRIWNSSLTKTEIIRSFEKPLAWNDLMAWGVQGRRIIDAWLGFAGTREVTRAARAVAKVKVLSVGRVQLPTLYFIVQRDVSHETFKSRDRWRLYASLSETTNKDRSKYFEANHINGLFDDEKIVNKLLDKLIGSNTAEVVDIKNKNTNQLPPKPLNTTAAVSLLSRLMKVNAKKALDLMVVLYSKGLLSYPRTENARFKDNFPHKKILSSLLTHKPFLPLIKNIKQNNQVVVNGKKKGVEDHDPIHPTGQVTGLQSLDKQQLRAWDILSRYYISLFMHDYIQAVVKVKLNIADELFLSEGRTEIQKGWKEAHNWSTKIPKSIPLLSVKQILRVVSIKIQKKPTLPPKRLTDANLLLAMESANIGTKSSRPDIIQKLVDRNYVIRKSRNLISTDWGRALIASLSPIWPEIVTPSFTAHVEKLMDEVAKGNDSFNVMLNTLRKEYIDLHSKLIGKIGEYKSLIKRMNLQSQATKLNTQNPMMLALLEKQFKILPEIPNIPSESDEN